MLHVLNMLWDEYFKWEMAVRNIFGHQSKREVDKDRSRGQPNVESQRENLNRLDN